MEAIARVSAVQQVEIRIKEHIMGDDVAIGDKLPTEKELCENLNVGRGTIREAIRLLQAKGFVELRPGKGAFVLAKREQDKSEIGNWFREKEFEIKDLIDVRTAIEPLAVRLAIMRCSDKDIESLSRLHEQSEEAARCNDSVKLALYDEKFHTMIVEFSNNKLLAEINKKIIGSLATFRGKTFNIPSNVENLIPAHAAIIEAFKQRDPELGNKSIIEHLKWVYRDLENSKDYR